MQQELRLIEGVPSTGHHLTKSQIAALIQTPLKLAFIPEARDDHYTVRSTSNQVGVIHLDDVSVIVNPAKCSPSLVVFMLGFARSPTALRAELATFDESESIWEIMIRAFAHQLRRALSQGLHRGYRHEDDAISTVRGRIRVEDQLRQRYRMAPPIEVSFDEYTEDVTENRLLKGALRLAHRLPISDSMLRQELRHLEPLLANVQHVEFDARRLPSVVWTRLNRHLEPAVGLAELILQNASISLGAGTANSPGFVVDMAKVFEDFVVVGVRDALGLSEQTFRHGSKALSLAENVGLEPDFSWWEAGECVAIGDVKYKKISVEGVLHPDLYQVFAYATAARLPSGMLVYARGEGESVTHLVDVVGKRLEVEILDLTTGPAGALAELARIAGRLKAELLTPHIAA